jgi:hypothetical protein
MTKFKSNEEIQMVKLVLSLFRQFNVKEVQTVETQIKNEIEKKKEELRAMV